MRRYVALCSFGFVLSCGGGFEPPAVFRVTNGSVAYDVDNDGFADVGLYQRPDGGAGEYRVYYGGEDGLDAERFASVGAGVPFGNAVWVGDIDGDGNADAAITAENFGSSPSITLVYGGADRVLEQRSVSCNEGVAPADEAGVRTARVGDVDGDGIDDLFARAGGGRICVWAGGARLGGEAPTYFFQSPGGSAVVGFIRAVGDVTGDGIDDVSIGNDLVVGGPDPLAADRETLPIVPFLGAADYNGDGRSDLLSGASGGRDLNQSAVYGSDSGFGAQFDYGVDPGTNVVTTESEWADLGDVDGDGRGDGAYAIPFRDQGGLDLHTDGHLVVLYGREDGLTGRAPDANGSDRIAPKHNFLPKASSAGLNGFRPGFAMGLGDINGDGFGDLGVENQSGGLVWYFGSAGGISSSQADGYVIFNRTSPRMATTGPGRW